MDFNTTLLWMVGATCIILLLRAPAGPSQRGRRRLAAGLLMLEGLSYTIAPKYAGFLVGAIWFTMLVGSGVGTRLVSISLAQRRFARAQRIAQIVSRIYPLDGYADYPQFIRALVAQQQGSDSKARAQLEEIASQHHALGWHARVMLTRQGGDWQGYLDWIETHPDRRHLLRDPIVLEAYSQALGETGRFEDMCRMFEHHLVDGGLRIPFGILNVARLKLAAFAGEFEIVDEVLASIRDVSPEIQDFWRATALQACGRAAEAQPMLLHLVGAADPRVAEQALHRLTSPVPIQDLSQIDKHIRNLFRDIRESLEQEAGFSPAYDDKARHTWGTWVICLSLLAVFAIEIPGGTTDIDNLIRLGALIVPASAGDGHWTRVVTAAFLHFGPTHLFLNMAGLILFGRRLEALWGAIGLWLVYLTSAVGSVALVPWFTFHLAPQGRMILVGASGGVMGLIGGMLGFQLWSLFSRWNELIAYDFRLLLLLVALQSLFDVFTPNVSTTCHLLGLSIGITVGLLNGYWRQRKSQPAARTSAPDAGH